MSDDKLFTGKTVEDAIAEGLRTMGLREADVEIEIVSRGSRGLFGLGSEPAQVRLIPRSVSGLSVPLSLSHRESPPMPKAWMSSKNWRPRPQRLL